MNIIAMNPVNSSQIASVGYDQTSATLAIEFKNGGVYHYSNVDPGTYQAMIGAKSLGSFFHQMIRANPHQFPHTKISGK